MSEGLLRELRSHVERGLVDRIGATEMFRCASCLMDGWPPSAIQHTTDCLLSRLDRAISTPPVAPAEGWRPEVVAFANLMERELRANDHKPGWKNDDADVLARRVMEEATELLDAVAESSALRTHLTASEKARVAEEAADVANMAMMVADVSGALAAAAPEPAGETEYICRKCGYVGPSQDHSRINGCGYMGLSLARFTKQHATPQPDAAGEGLAEQIVREVAELPDRTSPEDQPDMMLVTADELAAIVRAALSRPASGGRDDG
jgi:NTP pyrophosphatase (non-canonical NTP hydrolase)